MGDKTDGSSTAAQGALQDESTKPQDATQSSVVTLFDRMFRKRPVPDDEHQSFGTPEDILAATAGAREMLINVSKMRDMRIDDVAVPRADIVAVPDTASLDEVVNIFRDSTYTRLPVYTDTLDNPVGLIHLKDLALNHGFGRDAESYDMSGLLRPLIFAPPSMPMGVLLQQMQTMRSHMALVIDEYGGVDGLVTLEDIVEQIVGEIADEHDPEDDDLWQEEGPGVYLAYSRAPLDQFETMAGVDLLSDELDEDVDTLGGLVFMLAGRVPLRGEIVKDSMGHEFEVVDADLRQVKRIRVRLNSQAPADQAAE